jgi:hypothetical protein
VINMKRIKLLVAMILVVAVVSIGAMAASTDVIDFKVDTIACDGNAITVEVVSANGFDASYATFNIDFDSSKWTVSNIPSAAGITGGRVAFIYETGLTVAPGGTVFTITATPTNPEDVDSAFELIECLIVDASGEDIVLEEPGVVATLGVTKASTEPVEPPTSPYSSTMTAGGKTYTGVPNTSLTKNVDGALAGKVVVTYFKDGKADLSKDISFTAGDSNITGSGSVTFQVAIMGVPSDVIVTNIDAVLN